MTIKRFIVCKFWYVWVRFNLEFVKDMFGNIAHKYNIGTHKWEDGIESEVRFWRSWLGSKGLNNPEIFNLCTDQKLPLQEDLVALLKQSKLHSEHLKRILDVGSGPLTQIGKKCDPWTIEITPVDALAEKYTELLENYAIQPLVKTVNGKVEELSAIFEKNSFDIVCMNNALDHSEDPILGLEEMVKVVKPGGYIVLKHVLNEAKKERYRGFHKWNLCSENNEFIIWNKSEKLNINKLFNSIVDVGIFDDGNYIVVHLLKK